MSIKASSEPGTRSPLGNSTNHASESSQESNRLPSRSNSLRRKGSVQNFHPHPDSSDTLPSGQSSIFNAQYYVSSKENVNEVTPPPAPVEELWLGSVGLFVTGGSSGGHWRTTPVSDPSLERARLTGSPRSVHQPTQLTTIPEQKSAATLRNQASFPPNHVESMLSHTPSIQALNPALPVLPARRKTSFSLDDINIFKCSTRFFKHSSSQSSGDPPIPKQYPTTPIRSPPKRIPTPPGLPKFNTPAASAYRLPPPDLRFRDFFRIERPAAAIEWEMQTSALPRGVLMRGDNGVLIRGQWKAGQSGHTGVAPRHGVVGPLPLATHPLQRAPVAPVAKQRRVVFSPSTHGGLEDSSTGENGSVRGRGRRASTSGALPEGGRGVAQSGPEVAGVEESRWVLWMQKFCYVCCGAEPREDGMVHPRLVHFAHGRTGPEYARPMFMGMGGGS